MSSKYDKDLVHFNSTFKISTCTLRFAACVHTRLSVLNFLYVRTIISHFVKRKDEKIKITTLIVNLP